MTWYQQPTWQAYELYHSIYSNHNLWLLQQTTTTINSFYLRFIISFIVQKDYNCIVQLHPCLIVIFDFIVLSNFLSGVRWNAFFSLFFCLVLHGHALRGVFLIGWLAGWFGLDWVFFKRSVQGRSAVQGPDSGSHVL